MNCSHICQDLYKRLLNKDFKGIVHSVFNNSFNILDDDQQLVTFLNAKKPMSPNSIRIDKNVSFQSLGIKPKQSVYFSKEIAEIEGLNIKFNYKKIELWNKRPNLSFCKDNKDRIFLKLRLMGEVLSIKGNKEGIYLLVKSLENRIEGIGILFDDDVAIGIRESFIRQRFVKFIESYIDEDIDDLSNKARDIIGYGIGLTPSMDDFLSGIMVSRIYLSYYLGLSIADTCKLNNAIIRKVENKTTIVSQEMLKFSSLGEVNGYIKDFMVSFLGKFPMNIFIKNLENVMSIGETSGTDMLLGIYVGSCIMLNRL